jgi:hypothetical protein
MPFVVRGAGTGLSGGALPVEIGVVTGLARMRRILSVDVDNQRTVVQPGVTSAAISAALGQLELYFAPDPSSQNALPRDPKPARAVLRSSCQHVVHRRHEGEVGPTDVWSRVRRAPRHGRRWRNLSARVTRRQGWSPHQTRIDRVQPSACNQA